MKIVELGDNSMLIVKDSEDPFYFSIGKIVREAKDSFETLSVSNGNVFQKASDFVYTAGILILYFKDNVNSGFKLQDTVILTKSFKSK